MDIIIRSATISDVSAIAKVNIESWRSTYRGLVTDSILDNMKLDTYLEKWHHILTSAEEKDSFCFVVENDEDIIVGYALSGKNSHLKFDFNAELYAIYLLKEYQKQGIGKKLFRKSLEEFKKRSLQSFLLFVLSSNLGAREFYESFKPDFTANESITIDNAQYCDVCYGWSNIANIPMEQFFISPE